MRQCKGAFLSKKHAQGRGEVRNSIGKAGDRNGFELESAPENKFYNTQCIAIYFPLTIGIVRVYGINIAPSGAGGLGRSIDAAGGCS
jgi:hypothetical protein